MTQPITTKGEVYMERLDFSSVQAQVHLALGTGQDTILTATLSETQAQAVELSTFTDALSPGSSDQQWSALSLGTLNSNSIKFNKAFLHFNKTKVQFLLYGDFTGFGSALLLAQKNGAGNSMGYLFAFALSENFRFSNLFPGLSAIDEQFQITESFIAINSYELNSITDLQTQIDTILAESDNPDQIVSPIALTSLPDGTLDRGMRIYGALNFTIFSQDDFQNSAFRRVLEIQNEPEHPTLTLYASVSQDAHGVNTWLFQANFNGSITLLNLISFSGVQLRYTYIASEQNPTSSLGLSGTVKLTVSDLSLVFVGNISVEKQKASAQIALDTGQSEVSSLTNPYGMTGIEITGLAMRWDKSFDDLHQALMSIHGSVGFQSGQASLNAAIYFIQTNPVLTIINFTGSISLSQLVGKVVGDKANIGALFDLTLSNGGFYYYKAQNDPKDAFLEEFSQLYPNEAEIFTPSGSNTPIFEGGYNFYSHVTLTIIESINFHLNVQINSQGLVASATLDEAIDLYIIQILGPTFTGGPTFTFSTKGEKQMKFLCGLKLLGEPFGTADITIAKPSQGQGVALIGTLTSSQAFAVLPANTPLSFSYSKHGRFKLEGWPGFQFVSDALKIAKTIEKAYKSASAAKTGPCGALLALVVKHALKTRFSVNKPSFSTKDGTISMEFKLSYSLFFDATGEEKEVAKIESLTTLTIPLPEGTQLSDLLSCIETAITQNAKKLTQALINNPEKFAAVVVVMFGPDAAAKIVGKLVCAGLAEAASLPIAAAAAAAFLTAITGGLGILAAIGSALSAVTEFLSCFVAGTEVLLVDGKAKKIEEVVTGELLKGLDGLPNKVLKYDRPLLGNRLLYAFNGGDYFVTAEHPFMTPEGWKSIDPAATRRENPQLEVSRLEVGDFLIRHDGSHVRLEQIDSRQDDPAMMVYNFVLEGNNSYYADSYLVHNKGDSGGDSCFVAGTEVLLVDGKAKKIEEVVTGELLKGLDGLPNKVLKYDRPLLGNRLLYAFNGGDYFVTAEHPFMTPEGWKSIDPAATRRENPHLEVSRLEVGDFLIRHDGSHVRLEQIDSRQDDPAMMVYNFVLEGNNSYYADSYLVHNKGDSGGDSCFVAGTEVLLVDGTVKKIEDVDIGELLKGLDGLPNKVLKYDRPLLGNRLLYAFNGGDYFVTAEHPFMTPEGWKSIDPAATRRENPHLEVSRLEVGDFLIRHDGSHVRLEQIDSRQDDPAMMVYNFVLEGNNSYYADSYLVHNKGDSGGDSCFVAGTEVLLVDGTVKKIEDVDIGELLKGLDGLPNKVLKYDRPLLGNRLLYAFNGGDYFVTAEHPFMTPEGWKSIDPAATRRENPHLEVSRLEVGDFLIRHDGSHVRLEQIDSRQDDPAMMVYNFVLEGNNSYYADSYLVHNKGDSGGDSCFVAGTEVLLVDGTVKKIEDVDIGELLKGLDGLPNKVLKYDRPLLGNRLLYAFNGGDYFVTAEHPFMTPEGWKSIDPAATRRENPHLEVSRLEVGDFLIRHDGSHVRLEQIDSRQDDPAMMVYNFVLEGNNSYYADSYLVHNKGGQVQNPSSPSIKSLVYKESQLTCEWDATTYASGYSYQLLDPNNVSIESKTVGYDVVKVSINLQGELPAGNYHFKIQSVRGNFKSQWSDRSIQKLGSPTNVRMHYNNSEDTLEISWVKVAGSESFELKLENQGALVNSYSTKQSPLIIDNLESLAKGTYIAFLQANAKDKIPSEQVQSQNSIIKPEEPQDVQLTGDGQKVIVGFQSIATQQKIQVVLFNNGTKANHKLLSSELREASFNVDPNLAGPFTANVRIVGDSQHLPSNLSTSTSSIARLATPDQFTFEFSKEISQFEFSWNSNIPENSGYNLSIVNVENVSQALTTASVSKDSLSGSIPLQMFNGDSGTYQGVLRALGDNSHLDSTPCYSNSKIVKLGTPSNIEVSENKLKQTITVTFDPITHANSYEIEIIDQSHEEKIVAKKSLSTPSDTTNTLSIVFDVEQFTVYVGEASYQAKVQAIAGTGNLDSDFGRSSESIKQAAEPTSVTLNYTDEKIEIGWTPPAGDTTSTYLIQLVDTNDTNQIHGPFHADAGENHKDIPINQFHAGAGAYEAQVKTISKDESELNSNFAQSDSTITRLEEPGKVTMSYSINSDSFSISWQYANNEEGTIYEIDLVDSLGNSMLTSPKTITSDLSCIIALDKVPRTSESYHVKARVLPANGSQDIESLFVISNTITRVSAPTGMTLTYGNGVIHIGWTLPEADTTSSYEVQLVDTQDSTKTYGPFTAAAGSSEKSIALADFDAPAGTYKAQVITIPSEEDELQSLPTISTNTITRVSVPTGVTVSYGNEVIHVGWTLPEGDTTSSYEVQLVDAQDATNAFGPFTAAAGSSEKSIALADFDVPEGTYKAEVITVPAQEDELQSLPDISTNTITRVSAPTEVTVAYSKGSIHVGWELPEGDTTSSYEVQLVDAQDATNAFGPFTAAAGSSEKSIALADFDAPEGTYKAHVITVPAQEDELQSLPAISTNTITRASAPTGVTVSYGNGVIHIGWELPEGDTTSSYEVQLVDTQDATKTYGPFTAATGTSEKGIALGNFNAPAGTYKAQVITIPSEEDELQSLPTISTNTITRVSAPTEVTVAYSKGSIHVGWELPEGDTTSSYEVQLVDAQDATKTYGPFTAAIGASEKSIALADFDAPAGTYKAHVITVPADGDELQSLPAVSSNTITRISAPTGVTVTYGNESINVGWVLPEGDTTSSYEVQLVDSNNAGQTYGSFTTKQGANEHVIAVCDFDAPAGTYKARVKAVPTQHTTIDSIFANSVSTVKRVSAPIDVVLFQYKDRVMVMWTNAIPDEEMQCQVEIIDASNKEKLPGTYEQMTADACEIDLGEVALPTGSYQVQVQSIPSDPKEMSSLLALSKNTFEYSHE